MKEAKNTNTQVKPVYFPRQQLTDSCLISFFLSTNHIHTIQREAHIVITLLRDVGPNIPSLCEDIR
jgi:hypothetical protein